MIYTIIIIIFTIIFLGILIYIKYNNLNELKTNILTCDEKLNEYLTKKEKLINKVLKTLKNEKLKEEFKYNKEDSVHDKENVLFNIRWEINKYLLDNENMKEKIKENLIELNNIDDNIEGLKDFYNANVINYNELYLKKPFHYIYKLLKLNSFKSFKLRRLDDYEILKN